MLTKYERELVDYWKNWKPGMGNFGKSARDVVEIKPAQQVKVQVDISASNLAEDIGDRIWDII